MTTIIIISIALFIIIVVLPSIAKKMDEREKRIEHIKKEWKKAIDESVKETKLMNSKDIPTDEDIELYYKMYLKKKEIEARSQWTTKEPMSFEHWKNRATNVNNTSDMQYGGYLFMIRYTSDIFMGGTCSRIFDYKSMVLADEKEKE